MGYRAILESMPETVQDLELSARRRLEEATVLFRAYKHHTAIYVAGLSAEMYLKTACFFVGDAKPADPIAVHLGAVRPKKYSPPFAADFEAGHGLHFWSQELLHRRTKRGLGPVPNHFLPAMMSLYSDWFIGMRYRPGSASLEDAARVITNVEWLANNHSALRS